MVDVMVHKFDRYTHFLLSPKAGKLLRWLVLDASPCIFENQTTVSFSHILVGNYMYVWIRYKIVVQFQMFILKPYKLYLRLNDYTITYQQKK